MPQNEKPLSDSPRLNRFDSIGRTLSLGYEWFRLTDLIKLRGVTGSLQDFRKKGTQVVVGSNSDFKLRRPADGPRFQLQAQSEDEQSMRVMVLVKATASSEAGTLPSEQLL